MYNNILNLLNKYKDNFNFIDFYNKLNFTSKKINEIKTITIVQFDGIGDIVSISGCIRELKLNFPNAKLTFCCYENYYELVKFNSYIDKIILFPKILGNNSYEQIFNIITICKPLYEQENHLGIHFQYNEQNKLGNLILALTNTYYRIGYSYEDYLKYIHMNKKNKINDILLTHIYSPPENIINMVGKYYYLLLQTFILLKNNNLLTTYTISSMKNEIYFNNTIYDIKKPYIIISLSGSVKSKQLPINILIELINSLNESVILIGGKNEIDISNIIESSCKVINLTGKLSILESAYIISKADMYIGNDTGMSHIAACLNIPSIICWQESKTFTNESIKRKTVNYLSAYMQFMPFYGINYDNTKDFNINYNLSIKNSLLHSINLQPEKALYPCTIRKAYSGCSVANKHHCISNITVNDIINAINKLKKIF